MTLPVERKSMSGFFGEAVYPTGKSRQLVCLRFLPTTTNHFSRTPKADGDQVCVGSSVHRPFY